MSERLNEPRLSIEERVAYIAALPVFKALCQEEHLALADLMYEVTFHPGEIIVLQNTPVDSVYIITKGSAEVSIETIKKNELTKRKKIIHTPLATLHPGDTIGLNDTGFFSATGERTATVTAITDVFVLKIDLKELHDFLETYSHVQTAIYASAEEMMRAHLIKHSLPFSRISTGRLQELVKKIEELSVAAGNILFKQGDFGDCCYLIRSGEIEIFITNENNQEEQLALLKSPVLFGEATLITHSPRNATARAVSDSHLFVLRHEFLSELIESEEQVAKMFMNLMIDRSRPKQNPHVSSHPRMTADKQSVIILKNPDNGAYFKLSQEGWFIWQQLTGQHSMRDITLSLADKYNIFAPDSVAALISKLARSQFVENVSVNGENNWSKPFWVRALTRIRKLLEVRVVIGDSDKWLTTLYKNAGYLLFSKMGLAIMGVISVLGFFACGFATIQIIDIFKTLHDSWLIFVFLIPFTLLSVALHELGHALTMKSFGHEVHYMGVGWYWFSPVAFTDTTDMWLNPRGPRIAVNIAGICTDILVAGISSLLIFAVSNFYLKGFFWVFAVYTYINAFRMMSPLQELDGYYILMDVLDRNHLRQSSVLWLVKKFPKIFRKRSGVFRNYFPEVMYWVACLVYLTLVCIFTLFVQDFIFKILGIAPAHHWISLLIPFLVVIFSSLGIIADIRNQSDES